MQILKGVAQLPGPLDSSVVTIGNFDGVHRGHQELLARLLEAGKRLSANPVVFTFFPHPTRILTPEKPVLRIFDVADQRERLGLLGVRYLIEEPFTTEFSKISAPDFFENFLVKNLRPRAVVVGHDFSFGSKRTGGQAFLESICAEKKIELQVVPAVQVDGRPVSSSRIREALARGDVEEAAHCLGRPYYLKGEVVMGVQRGRTIGVPTANLRPLVEFIPRLGVYVSRTRVGTQEFNSITNVGTNPTFHQEVQAPLRVETHLFDFAGDLYGHEIRVELLKYLREEQRFPGVEELRRQIQNDLTMARGYFHG